MYKGEPLVKGNGLTGFTTGEEAAMKLIDVVPFLIEKNSKRFPDTKGWAYAAFDYDSRVGHVQDRCERRRQLRLCVPHESGGQGLYFHGVWQEMNGGSDHHRRNHDN
jgi:hypothetical protein